MRRVGEDHPGLPERGVRKIEEDGETLREDLLRKRGKERDAKRGREDSLSMECRRC